MTSPTAVSLLSVLVGVLSGAMSGHPALAQAGGFAAQQALPGRGLSDLLANPGQWATTMFNAALIGIAQKTTSDVVDFMGWILGNGNLISRTPPGLSYQSEAVRSLWGTMRLVANAGLAVVTVWGGVNLMNA